MSQDGNSSEISCRLLPQSRAETLSTAKMSRISISSSDSDDFGHKFLTFAVFPALREFGRSLLMTSLRLEREYILMQFSRRCVSGGAVMVTLDVDEIFQKKSGNEAKF